uniref:Uncharacterized protein n=1 Tax=Bursaphelenchus xylophilus TaxID=6326 RepID=A0A1I7S7R5_BURXY
MASHSPVNTDEYPEFQVLAGEHHVRVVRTPSDEEHSVPSLPQGGTHSPIDEGPEEYCLVEEEDQNKEVPEALHRLGIPTNYECEQATMPLDEDPNKMTVNTAEYSDLTEEAQPERSASSHRFSAHSKSIFIRIAAAYTRSHVHSLGLLNLFLSMLILGLLILNSIYGASLLTKYVQFKTLSEKDRPCFFEWGEWTQCTATCRTGDKYPMKSRRALGFIHATGVFANSSKGNPCTAEKIRELRDSVPCNVFKCPRHLSEFDFGPCILEDTNNPNGSCIQTREITAEDQYIELDNSTELYRTCNCSTTATPPEYEGNVV